MLTAMRIPSRRAVGAAVAIVVVLAAAALVAGWRLPDVSGRGFELELPGGENYRPLPVRFRDHAGIVAAFRADDRIDGQPIRREVVVNRDRDAIRLSWIGGACDSSVDLVLEPDGSDLRLRLHTTPTLDGMLGCIALGVERSVVIELSAPIDGRTVRLILD
jgi:hypothetical protein